MITVDVLDIGGIALSSLDSIIGLFGALERQAELEHAPHLVDLMQRGLQDVVSLRTALENGLEVQDRVNVLAMGD